jgi:hypothetical protein
MVVTEEKVAIVVIVAITINITEIMVKVATIMDVNLAISVHLKIVNLQFKSHQCLLVNPWGHV